MQSHDNRMLCRRSVLMFVTNDQRIALRERMRNHRRRGDKSSGFRGKLAISFVTVLPCPRRRIGGQADSRMIRRSNLRNEAINRSNVNAIAAFDPGGKNVARCVGMRYNEHSARSNRRRQLGRIVRRLKRLPATAGGLDQNEPCCRADGGNNAVVAHVMSGSGGKPSTPRMAFK